MRYLEFGRPGRAAAAWALVFLAGAGSASAAAETPPARWWLEEPVRLIQTNLPENLSTLDSDRLVQQVADFPANTLLFNLGGIVAQYPTRVALHYPSPYLPPGRDLFGEVLAKAHARGVRVIGRFDLSKTQPAVFAAHPEWFFKRVDGSPAVYNGLYAACINGGYYREHAVKILTEALEGYAVDGLFFNMFGNPAFDYAGVAMGPCQCDACREKFEARFGRPLPTTSDDADHRAFMNDSSREVASMLADLIHRLRPGAAFLTYIDDFTDGIVLEANTAISRPLPLWPYTASDNVARALEVARDKTVFNLCISFVDFPWRVVTVPAGEIQLRLWQNLAHGAPPALVVIGTMDPEDRQSLVAGRPVFAWAAQHPDLYVGQENAARVLLLTGDTPAYRGWFRFLTEQHIPFAVAASPHWLDDPERAKRCDLVIAPDGAAPELGDYVRGGGRLIVAGSTPPPPTLPVAKVVAVHPRTQGHWRIHDREALPSLRDTNLVLLDGPWVELAPPEPGAAPGALPMAEKPLLTFIPPVMFGPPEKVWVDKVETAIPGLVLADLGRGRVAYFPWDIGALYHRHSSTGHAGLMKDVVDRLLPGRQLRSDAHPLVEITVMRQPARGRTLVHLVNVSGHADTAYFAPVPMREIAVELAMPFTRARAVAAGRDLAVKREGATGSFVVPELAGYEVVELE